MNDQRPQDEIIQEVRRIREELAARHGYDLDRLYAAAKRREGTTGRRVIEANPKQIKPAAAQ